MNKKNKKEIFSLYYEKNLENLDFYKKFYAKYWENDLSLAERTALKSIIDDLSRLINDYEIYNLLS